MTGTLWGTSMGMWSAFCARRAWRCQGKYKGRSSSHSSGDCQTLFWDCKVKFTSYSHSCMLILMPRHIALFCWACTICINIFPKSSAASPSLHDFNLPDVAFKNWKSLGCRLAGALKGAWAGFSHQSPRAAEDCHDSPFLQLDDW